MNTFRQFWKWFRSNIFWIILIVVSLFFLFTQKTAVSNSHAEQGVFQSTGGGVAYDTAQRNVKMMVPAADMGYATNEIMPVPPVPSDGDGFVPDAKDKKIVKNANMTLEVKDTEKSRAEVLTQIEKFNGSVTNMNSWEVRPGVLAYNLSLRVPADRLEEVMKAIEMLGVKKSENFSTQDITAVYMDTANRLKNLESRRDRLRDLMNTDTKVLKDVLEIDRELASVQTEIENLQGIQRGRDTDVSYSVFTLTINPAPEVGDFQNPNWSFGRSWTQTVNDFIASTQGLVDKLLWVVVFLPLWGGVLVIVYFLRRWWKRKNR